MLELLIVSVSEDAVAETGEEDGAERLREDVGLLLLRRHPLHVDLSRSDVLADEVVSDVDVLRACVVDVVRCDRDQHWVPQN